jgi:HprK-related kinase A
VKHSIVLSVGPRTFRVGSDWRAPIAALEGLYAAYPATASAIPHFTVRLEAERWWRRFIRPSVAIRGDYTLPEAVPVSLAHGLLAAEMAMNLQMALGERHFLLLHAATVEKDGRALILTGESGSGKSTLSALLMAKGWRFMGDEFALIDPQSGLAHPFPRPVSLKNESTAVMQAAMPKAQFGPLLAGTPKGDIRHLVADARALAAMDVPAKPALIVFPTFGAAKAVRPMGQGESFVRLTQASTNYVALGERGFAALTGLVAGVPAQAIDYPDTATGLKLVEKLWAQTA